jgi:hypothetical protein
MQQAEFIQNHEKANARDIGKGEARHGKCLFISIYVLFLLVYQSYM